MSLLRKTEQYWIFVCTNGVIVSVDAEKDPTYFMAVDRAFVKVGE